MSVISLVRSRGLSFANFCALNPSKMAKERFPFFRLQAQFVCFDFISVFFFFKTRKNCGRLEVSCFWF